MLKSLEILVKLQEELDEESRLGERINKIPGELKELDQQLEKKEAELNDIKEEYDTVLKERVKLEKELDLKEEKKKKLKDQLMNVKDNVQYKATIEEISFIEKEMTNIEEQILMNLEKEDELSDKQEEAERALVENKKVISEKKKELDKKKQAMEEELTEIKETISNLREQVDPELLERYDMLVSNKQGVGIAGVKDDGICTACHFRIRPQVFAELVSDAGVQVCDNCQRLLYYIPPEVEEEDSDK